MALSYGYTPIRNISYGTQPIYIVSYGSNIIHPTCGGYINNTEYAGYSFYSVLMNNLSTNTYVTLYIPRDTFGALHNNSSVFTQSTFNSSTSPLLYSLYRYRSLSDRMVNATATYNITNSTSSNKYITFYFVVGIDNGSTISYYSSWLQQYTIMIPANTTDDYILRYTQQAVTSSMYIYPPAINNGYNGFESTWPNGLVCNKHMYNITPVI